MKNQLMIMAVSVLTCQMLFCSCSSNNTESLNATRPETQQIEAENADVAKNEETPKTTTAKKKETKKTTTAKKTETKKTTTAKKTETPKTTTAKKTETPKADVAGNLCADLSGFIYWFDEEQGVKGSNTKLDNGMELLVESAGDAPYQASIQYESISLEKDATYHIEFDYESDADLHWIYQVQQKESPYEAYTNNLLGKNGHYSEDFVMDVSDSNAIVTFSVSDNSLSEPYHFSVRNLVLTRKDADGGQEANGGQEADGEHIAQILEWLNRTCTADANEYAQTLRDVIETALSNLNGNGKFDGVYHHQSDLPDEIQKQAWEDSMWYGNIEIEIENDHVIACWTDMPTHSGAKQQYRDQYLNADSAEWAELWADMGYVDGEALYLAYGQLLEEFYGSYPKKTIVRGESLSDEVSGFSDTKPDIEAVKNS